MLILKCINCFEEAKSVKLGLLDIVIKAFLKVKLFELQSKV